MPRIAPIAAAALALAGPAAAQEVIGEITGTLDGVDRVWQTLAATGPGKSYNTGVSDIAGFMWDISIQGYRDGRPEIAGALSITLIGMTGEDTPQEAMILYVPERMSQLYSSPDEGVAAEDIVQIESLELHEDGGSVAGRFSAPLCFKDGFMATPDPEDCLEIEGRFTTDLPLDEGR